MFNDPWAMAVHGIRGIVEAAIQRAAQATGVDFGFLMKTASRESSFNPRARAASSSAAGLFQFVDQTWLATLKQHGAKHGYAQYADLISRGGDGRYHVSGSDARRAVMELKILYQSAEETMAKGLEQTWGYADRSGADEAHFILFDRNAAHSWDEKIYHRTEIYQGRKIEVWGC